MRRLLIGCSSGLVILVVLYCAGYQYARQTRSATAYLERLTGGTMQPPFAENVPAALLKRLPVGTTEAAVISYLEAHGVERDRFVGGQLMRYQLHPASRTVLVLLSDPPWLWSPVCSNGGYMVHMQFHANGKLENIVVNSTARCL